jgi:hypothetical protein
VIYASGHAARGACHAADDVHHAIALAFSSTKTCKLKHLASVNSRLRNRPEIFMQSEFLSLL